jgi:hypothetical protein
VPLRQLRKTGAAAYRHLACAVGLVTDPSLIAPLILVGREYWTDVYPAWPLLQRLSAGRPMAELIYCVNDVKEAAALLAE